MKSRRSEYDVTNKINITNPDAVCDEVCKLFADIYPEISNQPIKQAYQVISRLFRGEYPGYHPCDTPYHDLQHTLDVSLAMIRLLYGYENGKKLQMRLGPDLIILGTIVSVFHDSGYIRRLADHRQRNGAAYTKKHITRGGDFLAKFLPEVGMEEMIPIARQLIHFTGYEMPISAISLHEPNHGVLGKLLGTADLLAQVSDRCYLEKCKNRLYFEFVTAGMAGPDVSQALYQSSEELIYKTPQFFKHILYDRLDGAMHGMHRYIRDFFLPERDHYRESLEKNCAYLERIVDAKDISLLRRQPPWTLVVQSEPFMLA